MSDSIALSSVTIACPDAVELAGFYAAITGGEVTFEHPSWATLITTGGRIDFQTVPNYSPPTWPEGASSLLHLDFLVDDLEATSARVQALGASRFAEQPNARHCLVFADPVGHPFCLTTIDQIS